MIVQSIIQIGFAPGIPHFANLPFGALHRVAFAGALAGHLTNFPVFGSLHGAASAGDAVIVKATAANIRFRTMASSGPIEPAERG
ncbi:hypothetical protein NF701_06340 [Sphingomonadaceae bacterium OTU29THOMA1]|nr:hypothetical protein NF701_06340 [Sphingomonadaceae bacterium OTU29THOMA1]